MQLLQLPPSPLQLLRDPNWEAAGVQLFIKRDDLLGLEPNDPWCGNKWRKLKYNLQQALAKELPLLTFGGAYSNHLAAVASAGRQLGMHTMGIVRGEPVENPTLSRAKADGMQLFFVSRSDYRRRYEPTYLSTWQQRLGPCLILPEGGTNALAYPGCAELATELLQQAAPTHIALACGTGGTFTGLLHGLNDAHWSGQAIGISVLKGDFMTATIQKQLQATRSVTVDWRVAHDFHHGGYARQSDELRLFIQRFHERHNILLEPIYTGKLFFALQQLLVAGVFQPGDSVVGVHTGGLQAFGCAWGLTGR